MEWGGRLFEAGRLLTFSAFSMGAYSRWALIRGWALIRINTVISVTNISELLEYVLLPHNDDVTKPRALNTFLDGLAELGIDKGLIKNKKLLSDLIEKEKGYRNNENTFGNESNVESSSD